MRQQIFSLTKIKGGWLKTTHLFNSPDQAYFYEQATRLYQQIVAIFDTIVGYRNVLSNSKFTPVNDKNEFGHSRMTTSGHYGREKMESIASPNTEEIG